MLSTGMTRGYEGEFAGFIAEHESDLGASLSQGSVVAWDGGLGPVSTECDLAIAIGEPQIKARVANSFVQRGFRNFPNLVHMTAQLNSPFEALGEGNIVFANAFISCDVQIGAFCLFNWNVTIGHDARVGSYVVVNPHAHVSGHCAVGSATLLGASSVLLEGVQVGERARVGAGAVVVDDVAAGATVVGVPAKAR